MGEKEIQEIFKQLATLTEKSNEHDRKFEVVTKDIKEISERTHNTDVVNARIEQKLDFVLTSLTDMNKSIVDNKEHIEKGLKENKEQLEQGLKENKEYFKSCISEVSNKVKENEESGKINIMKDIVRPLIIGIIGGGGLATVILQALNK